MFVAVEAKDPAAVLSTLESQKPLLGSESKTLTETKTPESVAVIDTVQEVRKSIA